MDKRGHLFAVKANIKGLTCDAWLVPCNQCGGHAIKPPGFNYAQFGLFSDRERTTSYGGDNHDYINNPIPFLTYVNKPISKISHRIKDDITWVLQGVEQFVTKSLHYLKKVKKRAPLNRRQRYLLALPLINTGYGGGRSVSGLILQLLIPLLVDLAAKLDCDIALVSVEDASHAAVQTIRLRYYDSTPEATNMTNFLKKQAERLAKYAMDSSLSLFFGAGVSVGAGLPTWGGLLERLGKESGMDEEERETLKNMNFLDQARIIEMRLKMKEDKKRKFPRQQQKASPLQRALSGELKGKYFSVTHSLLADLPIQENVTTNYDTLFEQASDFPHVYGLTQKNRKRTLTVLPYERRGSEKKGRWLLKMHGCVNHPSDIVLTRSDYNRYSDRRAALAGIVQSMLITKHMLFVGFSLNDENFHRIMDAVRGAMPEAEKEKKERKDYQKEKKDQKCPSPPPVLGTALMLNAVDMQAELWGKELDILSMDASSLSSSSSSSSSLLSAEKKKKSIAILGRRLEIFLDYLGALCVDFGSFLLSESNRFSGMFSKEDEEIRELILKLVSSLPKEAEKAISYPKLQNFLDSLNKDC